MSGYLPNYTPNSQSFSRANLLKRYIYMPIHMVRTISTLATNYTGTYGTRRECVYHKLVTVIGTALEFQLLP
jgi:hypothetical protein